MTTPADPPSALFCPNCTYDLRYTTDPRCPECGTPFDRNDLAVSRIPWVHRKQKSLGLFKAWRQTALLVIRPSTRLAHEVALPIDPIAASRFRRLNVFLATLLLAAGNALLYPFVDADIFRVRINFTYDRPELTLARILSPAVALIDGTTRLFTIPIIAFATFTALSWWTPFLFWITAKSNPFRPRAAALSLYLSSWLPIAVLLFFANLGILFSLRDSAGGPSTPAVIAVIVLGVFSLFTWWFVTVFLYSRTTNAGLIRGAFFALIHPLGALFLLAAVSIATAFLLGLAALIFVSITT